MSNESEVFLPDLLHCTVLEETTDGTYLGKRFERIYRLGIDSEETPFRNGNFWNSQASNRMFRCRTGHRPGRDGRRTGQSRTEP